jgi:hypothetical protein
MIYYLSGAFDGDVATHEDAQKRLNWKEIDVVSGLLLESSPQQALSKLFTCDGVIVFPGWAKSEKVRGEVFLALTLGMPIYAYHQHRPELLEELKGLHIVTRAEMMAQ